jgi:hypothetical protein
MLKVLTPRGLRILARTAGPVPFRAWGEAPLPVVRYLQCFDAQVPLALRRPAIEMWCFAASA